MLRKRVIPTLLISETDLVKTRKFSDPKYVGDPINAIKIFNDKEVDEIMVVDIMASKNKTRPSFQLIEEMASECFMPLSYGGGIKSLEDAATLFSLGVEKVCLQTQFLENPQIITQLSKKYGSQSVQISIDIKKDWMSRYALYCASSKKIISTRWLDFVKRGIELGAGEIVLNSVDLDGVMGGMDLRLIKELSAAVQVPIVALGGVGSLSDIKLGFEAGADAVAAGSFFVFHGPHRAVLITYPNSAELAQIM